MLFAFAVGKGKGRIFVGHRRGAKPNGVCAAAFDVERKAAATCGDVGDNGRAAQFDGVIDAIGKEADAED